MPIQYFMRSRYIIISPCTATGDAQSEYFVCDACETLITVCGATMLHGRHALAVWAVRHLIIHGPFTRGPRDRPGHETDTLYAWNLKGFLFILPIVKFRVKYTVKYGCNK